MKTITMDFDEYKELLKYKEFVNEKKSFVLHERQMDGSHIYVKYVVFEEISETPIIQQLLNAIRTHNELVWKLQTANFFGRRAWLRLRKTIKLETL